MKSNTSAEFAMVLLFILFAKLMTPFKKVKYQVPFSLIWYAFPLF